MLYQTVQAWLETFLLRHTPDPDDPAEPRTMPRFVTEELRAFLACGIAAHGFCRVYCTACGKDELVAFSCKRRGFCPSCCGRRMADTAAFLVDEVLPAVPVRQWVLSLPHTLRVLCAYNPEALRAVRALFVRAVSLCLLRKAPRDLPRARPGAIVFVQRCDSALRLDVHFHALFADGVFACGLGERRATFHPLAELIDDDIARVVRKIQNGVQRFLRKRGLLREPDEPVDSTADTDLLQLHGASAEGRAAFGNHRGQLDCRPGRGSASVPRPNGEKSLCRDLDGFSLHAATCVAADRTDRLEHLIRYVARPPIANDRLAVLPDGRIAYALKKRWRDGSTHVVLDPMTFLERLCALVPRPHKKLVTYHGVFAPAAGYRDRVVPERSGAAPCRHLPSAAEEGQQPPPQIDVDSPPPHRRPRAPHVPRRKPPLRRRYYPWAELLRRVFGTDALVCPDCRGPRRLLAFLTDPPVVRKILAHLGMATQPPALARARPPPTQRATRFHGEVGDE